MASTALTGPPNETHEVEPQPEQQQVDKRNSRACVCSAGSLCSCRRFCLPNMETRARATTAASGLSRCNPSPRETAPSRGPTRASTSSTCPCTRPRRSWRSASASASASSSPGSRSTRGGSSTLAARASLSLCLPVCTQEKEFHSFFFYSFFFVSFLSVGRCRCWRAFLVGVVAVFLTQAAARRYNATSSRSFSSPDTRIPSCGMYIPATILY